MVGGVYTHLDDMLASQYQSIDWTKHNSYPSSISVRGTFWLLAPCMIDLHYSMLGPVNRLVL